MGRRHLSVLIALSLLGCKRTRDDAPPAPLAAPVLATPDAGLARVAEPAPTWYRATVRAADGVEVPFLLGVPAPDVPGEAIFRVGGHDVRSAATFDGKTLNIPLAVHQTTVDATIDPAGVLHGTFATTGRAWGASSIPLTATKIAAPSVAVLEPAGGTGPALDLGAPRTVWRLAMSDSGVAKLVIEQPRPGELTGLLSLATGNLIYLAGTARGDAIVLSGFDGTSGYRLALALDAGHARAGGTFVGGERLDWRETVSATRGAEFALAIETRPVRPGVKIGLPNQPELAALPPGPLLVEISASWCSTCRNAAPFLVELARTYQPRGLRMVTLLYDLTDDRAADAKQAAIFKAAYGVTWPVVAVSGGLDVLPEILPSGVVGVNPAGFPITLFLAADRSLVALHAGFPAADARDEFGRVTAEFRATIESLLAKATKD
jgi:thiol-disulfide isomerase/thioredoxin